MNAIKPMEDVPARDLLVARNRSWNALFQTVPIPFTPYQMEYVNRLLEHTANQSTSAIDVATLVEIPSYGPSFLAMWEAAHAARFSSKQEIASYFLRWRCNRPPAWDRSDKVDPKIARRLRQELTWVQTGDNAFPWESTGRRGRMKVRLNEYPDEWMYTLFLEDAPLGDFHDWPEAWDRGEYPSRAAIMASLDPAALLKRYQAGELRPVWEDLIKLGDAINSPPFQDPARAVARETMRRARSNMRTIIDRLNGMYYRFRGEPMRSLTPDEQKQLEAMKMPLSLRAWYEEVGVVDLRGYHRKLCSPDSRDIARPLEMKWPPELHRKKLVRAADFQTEGPCGDMVFVDFIRLALEYGGFPGWSEFERAPKKEIGLLSRDLIPF